jgi:dedicated sortase system histidine kinase
MPLRYQLLLLSLLTLLLPWAGCQYAREMETVLRDGQEQTLLASAGAMARLLASRPALIETDGSANRPFDPAAGDLYAYRLRVRPLLDGYGDDWGLPEDAFATLRAQNARLTTQYAAAIDDDYVYLLLLVTDSQVQLEDSSDPHTEPEDRADHVWIAFDSPQGMNQLYLFATSAPGLISARRPTLSSYGERSEQVEPLIQAYWQPDPKGYRLEARIPLALVGDRFGFEVVDIGEPGSEPVRAGTLTEPERQAMGRLLRPSAALARELSAMLPPAARVIVGDSKGWVIGEAGSIQPAPLPYESQDQPSEWALGLYRGLLESGSNAPPVRTLQPGRLSGKQVDAALQGKRGAAWFRLRDERRTVLSVATPIETPTGRLGVLVLEQAGDRLLLLRDRALTRLLNLTLFATTAAVVATLAFAAILSMRLGRLKRAAETALTDDGRLNVVIPETHRNDELGDVARSYAVLLRRLNEYTAYLRTLAGKLSHELRTPLAIVRSSLENLESERGATTEPYLSRAREGTERLQAILTAMGAATRTEEAIRHAERVRFDLAMLVCSTVRAYADAFPERHFVGQVGEQPCWVMGAPDLVVQLLDKLVDNAVDFSAPRSVIEIALEVQDTECVLTVQNEGPPIPPAIHERLFDSMFQYRRDTASKPHFGLGLYIVRLVAEFHGGRASAENLSDRHAVRFTLRLPRAA